MKQAFNSYLASLAMAVTSLVPCKTEAALDGPHPTTPPISIMMSAWDGGAAEWGGTISFPKFNPAVGTLNSVTFEWDVSISPDAALPSLGALMTVSTLTADMPSGPSELWKEIDKASPMLFGVNPFIFRTGDRGHEVHVLLDPILAAFTGAGNASLSVHATVLGTFSLNGNATPNASMKIDTKGWVSYDYSPVPEPSTYLAGLSALGMLGLFGRRKRR